MMSKIDNVLVEVADERKNQDSKWGEQNHHPYLWLAILGEEVGECSKAALEAEFDIPCGAKINYSDLGEELIQVAAVAVAIVESLDRNNK